MKHTKKSTKNVSGGMSYRQIGRVLGISMQEVQRVEKIALRKLYFRLKPFIE